MKLYKFYLFIYLLVGLWASCFNLIDLVYIRRSSLIQVERKV